MRYLAKEQVVIFTSTVLIFIGIFGMNAPVAQADDGCGGTEPQLTLDQADSAEIVYQINLARRSEGLPPYKMSEKIMLSAAYHANDMAEDDYFFNQTHDVVDGELVKICGTGRRMASFYGPIDTPNGEDAVNATLYTGLGVSINDTVRTWLSVDSTRVILLAPTLQEIGVGQEIEDRLGVVNTVAEYLLNADYFPLVIDDEAAEMSDSNTVELYVYGDWQEIRIRENGSDWSDWMPFSNEMSWDFSPITGENVIDAEMRSGSVTTQSSDTIIGVKPTSVVLQENVVSTNWLVVAHTMIALFSAGMVMLTVLAIVFRANQIATVEIKNTP